MILNTAQWQSITDVGDAAVMLPVAVVLIVWLAAGRAWKLAALNCVVLGIGLGLVTLTKVTYVAWGFGFPKLPLFVISGHAMLATMVLMAASYYLLARRALEWRLGAVFVAFCVGGLVAASRVMVNAHPFPEALVGFMLGAALGAMLVRAAIAARPPTQTPAYLFICLIAVFAISYGQQAPSNRLILDIARKAATL
jgi:membrane-associated phospholipid phosphatase